jgi:hypothetical protein
VKVRFLRFAMTCIGVAGLLAASAGAAFAGTQPGGALHASAFTTSLATVQPVVEWKVDGWKDMKARPSDFYFGEGGGPYVTGLRWKHWTAKGAYGTGKLWTQALGCTPSYECAFTSRAVSLTLGGPRSHGTERYFARMTVRTHRGSAHVVRHLTFQVLAGATAPYWTGAAAWPYL